MTQMTDLERIAYFEDMRYDIRREGGTIGMMTNGAGTAMALDDLITANGGMTASYLDLFGDTDFQEIEKGLELMEFDNRVKCVVINVFSGTFETKMMVRAIRNVRERKTVNKPIVIRLKGNDMDEAEALIKELKWEEILKTGK